MLRLALALVVALALPLSALADTVVFWGGGVCGTSSALPLVAHADTGCPDSGSYNAQTLAIGTDGTVCVCTVAGSPGTWVEVGASSVALNDLTDVTITSASTGEVVKYNGSAWVDGTVDGSDVGLADSPSSDGVYNLTRSSGANSWTAATAGGASWTAGTTEGLETLNTSGVVLATWPLPSGWMANGASAQIIADVLTISNSAVRSVDLRWQFRAADDSPVFYITGSGSVSMHGYSAGQAAQVKLDIYVSDVTSGFFFRTASRTTLSISIATNTAYIEAMSSLATATKIVLLGEQDSGSDVTMTAFAIRGMDTTP